MQTIQSFFAPAPYGTPWTKEQVRIIQGKQVNTGRYINARKTKLANKRLARLNAIAKLKNKYGSGTFTSIHIRTFLGFDHVKTNNLIMHLRRKQMIEKVGKYEITSSFVYKFTDAKII